MNVGEVFFAAFLSLGIFLPLSPRCLHNEQHNRGAVIYAWIICLLLLEQCFKIAHKANALPHAHGHACTWVHILFPSSYFPILISHPSCLWSGLSSVREKFLPCKQSSGFLGGSWRVSAPSLSIWVTGAFPPCQCWDFHIAFGDLKDFVAPWIEFKPCSRWSFYAVSNFWCHKVSVTFVIADWESLGLGPCHSMQVRPQFSSIHLKYIMSRRLDLSKLQ